MRKDIAVGVVGVCAVGVGAIAYAVNSSNEEGSQIYDLVRWTVLGACLYSGGALFWLKKWLAPLSLALAAFGIYQKVENVSYFIWQPENIGAIVLQSIAGVVALGLLFKPKD